MDKEALDRASTDLKTCLAFWFCEGLTELAPNTCTNAGIEDLLLVPLFHLAHDADLPADWNQSLLTIGGWGTRWVVETLRADVKQVGPLSAELVKERILTMLIGPIEEDLRSLAKMLNGLAVQ